MAEVPFSNTSGGVSGLPELLGQRDFTGWQAMQRIGKQHPGFIAAHPASDGQPARQQRRPTGRAYTGPYIELCPFLTLPRHLIQIGSFDRRMPERPQVTVAHVIDKYDDKIGAILRRGYLGITIKHREIANQDIQNGTYKNDKFHLILFFSINDIDTQEHRADIDQRMDQSCIQNVPGFPVYVPIRPPGYYSKSDVRDGSGMKMHQAKKYTDDSHRQIMMPQPRKKIGKQIGYEK